MKIYVQGVSIRKVRKVIEQMCRTSFSKSAVSLLAEQLDEELDLWLDRPLEAAYQVLIVHAQFYKFRVTADYQQGCADDQGDSIRHQTEDSSGDGQARGERGVLGRRVQIPEKTWLFRC